MHALRNLLNFDAVLREAAFLMTKESGIRNRTNAKIKDLW